LDQVCDDSLEASLIPVTPRRFIGLRDDLATLFARLLREIGRDGAHDLTELDSAAAKVARKLALEHANDVFGTIDPLTEPAGLILENLQARRDLRR